MRNLPRAAQIYLIAVCLVGGAAGILISLLPLPGLYGTIGEMGIFIVLAAVMGGQKVQLLKKLLNDEVGSMSLGFAITFAALVRFGPSFAVVIGALSSLSGCVYPKRQPLYQLCFNVALVSFETAVGGICFLLLNGWTMNLRPLDTFVAITGAVLVIFLINTGGVALIISLCTDQKPYPLWRQTFLWTAPSYFAGASIGALAMVLFTRSTGIIILFVSPVAYLTYLSYTSYTLRTAEKQKHLEELQVNQTQLAELYLSTIKSLALAIDAKDQYTHQHILRVQTYSVAIAKEMGFEGSELEAVNTGALLHDIGKLGVPEYVLLKPGRLTAEEFEKIKKHPEIGAAILDPVEFPWPVLPVVRHHHEKFDGTGYPDGLAGEDIPLTARVMAVADVYDALTSTRSYRKGWTHERARETIIEGAGTHFDPRVVAAFERVIDGVVTRMAEDGEGPLAPQLPAQVKTTKADEAARQISRASSELWALYEVAQSLSTSLGVQETINILAHKLDAIFPDAGSAFLLSEPDGNLLVRAAAGVNRDYFLGARTFKPESTSQTVRASGASYLDEFDPEDLMLISAEFTEWVPMRTALIVPIVHQGEALGTINLYHEQAAAFSDHDRELLEMIAERSALALYNGMLYERTKGDTITDPLTGLFNIRYFTDYVEQRCRERATDELRDGRFSLLCLDLDSFKPINDNFGHQKGDDVLREIATLLRESMPSSAVVARYGSDEFLIFLDNADETAAVNACHRLQASVRGYDPNLVHYKLGKLRVDVSFGHACFPDEGSDCASLITSADSKMGLLKTERKLGALASKERKNQKVQAA